MALNLVADAVHASAWMEAFRGFSHAAAPLALTALWQSAALACGLGICLRLAPRASAAHRFSVWAAAFAAVAALPFLPLLLALHWDSSGNAAQGLAAAAPGPWLDLDIRWSLAIGGLWIAASAVRTLDLGFHSWRLHKLWKGARPLETERRAAALAASSLAASGRRVEVCATRELDRPSLIGFFRPRILIPEWLLSRLTEKELEQVVLHEAEHLRRRDDWTNLLQKLCLVVFPLNPALAWMERRLCREREMACDEGVVRVTQSPRAYAACLATLAERRMEHRIARRAEALSLGAWQRRPELVKRVHRILRRGQGLSPWAAKALLGTLGCGLVFGSVEFARCPQLVAFVPAQRLTAQELAPAAPQFRYAAAFVEGSARRGEPGFRAIDTVAHMRTAGVAASAPRPAISAGRAAAKTVEAVRPKSADAETALAAPHEELLKAEMPAPHEPQEEAGQGEAGQWVVLTTWREVETATAAKAAGSPDSNRAGDRAVDSTAYQVTDEYAYQYSEALQSAPGAAARRQPAAGQAEPNPETGSRITVTRLILRIYSANPRSNSIPWQPGAFPMGNGWLVIQL